MIKIWCLSESGLFNSTVMISSSKYPSNKAIIAFFLMAMWNPIVYMHHIFFIPSLVGHLGLLPFMTIVNSTVVRMHVLVSLSYTDLESFKYISSNDVA